MISSYKKGSYLEVSEHSLSVAIHSKSSAKIIFLMWLIWKRKSNETDPWDASLTWRDHLLSHKSLLQSMVMSTLINFDSDFYVEKKKSLPILGNSNNICSWKLCEKKSRLCKSAFEKSLLSDKNCADPKISLLGLAKPRETVLCKEYVSHIAKY